jgi:hypothetical protein
MRMIGCDLQRKPTDDCDVGLRAEHDDTPCFRAHMMAVLDAGRVPSRQPTFSLQPPE